MTTSSRRLHRRRRPVHPRPEAHELAATARRGIMWAGVGMVVAVAITFATPEMGNFVWMTVASGHRRRLAYVAARRVAMTDMPQMVALYNGMGGGAAALIAAVEFMSPRPCRELRRPRHHRGAHRVRQVRGHDRLRQTAGASSRSRSSSRVRTCSTCWCWPRRSSWPSRALQHTGNSAAREPHPVAFFALALLFGVLMTLPIGGADMPVVISLYNALTGLAVGFEGYVLGNARHDHRRHGGRVGGHAADAADGQGHEPLARQRPLLRGSARRAARSWRGMEGCDEGDRPRTTRPSPSRSPEGHHRARLRHGRGAGPAQGVGAGEAAR